MSRTVLVPRIGYIAACVGSCLWLTAASGCAQAQTATTQAAAKPLTCAPTATLSMPAGVSVDRLKLLDDGKHFTVYTSVEESDERAGSKSTLPRSMAKLVDFSPSSLNRIFTDTILASKRFKVYDMRPNVTAEFSDVLITAKIVDADQVVRPYLEGGRRVSESRVKLSIQVKNMYTGENLLPADAFVEGKTGLVSGDRVMLTSADDMNSPDIQQKLVVDMKNAMYRAFRKADQRIEELLRPMARVISSEECQVDLFGGSRMGLLPSDELLVFRTQLRQLGDTTVMSNTRVVAQLRCTGTGTDTSQCTIIKATAGYRPQDGDYAVVTDESLNRGQPQ